MHPKYSTRISTTIRLVLRVFETMGYRHHDRTAFNSRAQPNAHSLTMTEYITITKGGLMELVGESDTVSKRTE